MTFEDLSTLLTQIEGILNPRPIAYRKYADRYAVILCPSHFLIGDTFTSIAEAETTSYHYLSGTKLFTNEWIPFGASGVMIT